MFSRPHYIDLGLVVVLTLVVLDLKQRTAGRLKLAIGGLFLPLFGLSSSSQQATAEGIHQVDGREGHAKAERQVCKQVHGEALSR